MRNIKIIFLLVIILVFLSKELTAANSKKLFQKRTKMIFAVMAENDEQLKYSLILAESIKKFAGKYKNAPIWVMIPGDNSKIKKKIKKIDKELNIIFKEFDTPKKAIDFVISRKVFAASRAEEDALEKTDVLVWMDKDTVVLREPVDFELKEGKCFGYKPVMHRLIGSLYNEPLDKFWRRVYKLLSVKRTSVFSMITPADNELIRPYFNAGLIVAKPEKRIFKNWSLNFIKLYNDPEIILECKNNFKKRIFLHQVALAGTVLNLLNREEMYLFNENVNYPLFFKKMFEGKNDFRNIKNAVTVRYDMYFRNPERDWTKIIIGSQNKIDWLEAKFDLDTGGNNGHNDS